MPVSELEQAIGVALAANNWPEVDRLGDLFDQDQAARRWRLAEPGALASSAAWYAGQGIPIFPVQPAAKVPLVRWRDEATTDAEHIAAWWRRWPQANIGMPTGIRWDVIDIDGPPHGYLSLGKMRADGQLPAVLGRSLTPRAGGMHLFVAPTGQGNAADFLPGVDFRGLGGYVVLPPSWGANGRQYEWDLTPAVV